MNGRSNKKKREEKNEERDTWFRRRDDKARITAGESWIREKGKER